MSTVSTSQPTPPQPPLPDESDPFRYGWRYVSIKHPDGTEGLEQVPLTLEDALHPEPGDYIVHSDPHDTDLNYLKDVFKSLLAHDSHAFVLSDCGVDWNLPGVKPSGRTFPSSSAWKNTVAGRFSTSRPSMRIRRSQK